MSILYTDPPSYITETTWRIGYSDEADNYEEPSTKSKICSAFILVLNIICLLFSFIMIIIGSVYAAPLHHSLYNSGCPGEVMLPWFTIIGGIILFILAIIRLGLTMKGFPCKHKNPDEMGLTCELCSISCVAIFDIVICCIALIWLIAGTKFFVQIFETVNYITDRPNEDTCDRVMFEFSYFCVVAGWIFLANYIFIMICCRFCECCSACARQVKKSRANKTKTTDVF